MEEPGTFVMVESKLITGCTKQERLTVCGATTCCPRSFNSSIDTQKPNDTVLKCVSSVYLKVTELKDPLSDCDSEGFSCVVIHSTGIKVTGSD